MVCLIDGTNIMSMSVASITFALWRSFQSPSKLDHPWKKENDNGRLHSSAGGHRLTGRQDNDYAYPSLSAYPSITYLYIYSQPFPIGTIMTTVIVAVADTVIIVIIISATGEMSLSLSGSTSYVVVSRRNPTVTSSHVH